MNGQEIAGFLGVILGAVLTYSLQGLQRRSQRKEEQKTASMLVAIQLRSWLTECDQAVLSHLNHESTGGEMGAPLSNLPSTNFEQYFDQVARLGTAEAKSVFDWIHKTKEAKRNYDYLRDAVDGEIAEDQLLEESGVLFSSGLKVYKALTNAVVGVLQTFLNIHCKG